MSSTESSNPVLAVLAKLQLIYEQTPDRSDTFLSFPMTSLPWTMDDLDFVRGQTDVDEKERQRRAADFATLVNHVPEPSTVWQQRTTLLWQEYGRVFTHTKWGTAELSEEEERELEEAKAVARDEEIIEKYNRYQSEYHSAKIAYNNARNTAEYAVDEEVQARAEAKLERLHDEKEAALDRWRAKGYKEAWESANDTIERLENSGPTALWDHWREKFKKPKETELYSNRRVYRTGYFPRDFTDDETDRAWTEITLDGSEVDSLCRKAREDMPELVGSPVVDSDIQASVEVESLSFEIGTVEVRRPWFSSNLLRSRGWRWRSGEERPLSDGGDPPEGRLPCYVSKLVFARNLSIELTSAKENEATIRRLQTGDLTTFGPLPLEQLPTTKTLETVESIDSAKFDAEEVEAIRELDRELADQPDKRDRLTTPEEPTDTEIALDVEHAELLSNDARLSRMATIVAGNSQESSSSETSDDASSSSASSDGDQSSKSYAANVTINRPIKKLEPKSFELPEGNVVNTPPGVLSPGVGTDDDEPDGGYQGVVREETDDGLGDPIADVKITFREEDGAVHETVKSDEAGRYRVTLPDGRYVVTARREGYETYTTDPGFFVVDGEEYQTGNVFLTPASRSETVDKWETMMLVGFVCRTMPKAPNPDPELSWN